MNTHCICWKKTSLHFDWRQMIDLSKQVTTWCHLRGLSYDHTDDVCLLIYLNCIELQPSINILIWVVWLFDHPARHKHRSWCVWVGFHGNFTRLSLNRWQQKCRTCQVETGHNLLLTETARWNIFVFLCGDKCFPVIKKTAFQQVFIQMYCYGIWVLNFQSEFI
jgi:hypothetical protein